MRTLARYVKRDKPSVEVITKTTGKDYKLLFGGRVIASWDVGSPSGMHLARLFIKHYRLEGYEPAIHEGE